MQSAKKNHYYIKNISKNERVKAYTTLANCHGKSDFTYFPILHKPSRIASNAFGHGFHHFFKETRLNQMHTETQHVTIKNK